MEEQKTYGAFEDYSRFDRYSIVSKTYTGDFEECILLIFDKKTGEVKKRVFKISDNIKITN